MTPLCVCPARYPDWGGDPGRTDCIEPPTQEDLLCDHCRENPPCIEAREEARHVRT